jgi:anti-sigma regulatory factor (Ser/Thr protein kinase)
MLPSLSQTIEVDHSSHVGTVRRSAKELAESIGFNNTACEEIILAVTELATNLIKHAKGGKLILTTLTNNERIGLEIESCDNGSGINDIEQAFTDHFSTTGTHGTGLGAVNRLMDDMDISSERGRGTHIICHKWVRRYTNSNRPCPLEFGVATRPRRLGTDNGDAFIIKQWSEIALAGIIDGLGHGQFAHRAAQTARQYVEGHFDQPLDQIFRGVGRACRATRGVVMALARFDWGCDHLSFASVGNIEVRIFPGSAPFRFTIRRGVIGLNAPDAVVTEHSWPLDHMLVLHSDGLSTHWSWKDFHGLADKPSQVLAHEFLRVLSKEDDDATIIVVRSLIK